MMDFYNGTGKKRMPQFVPNQSFGDKEKYILTPGLQKAVNVAILLGQPLLLTGEPGTGKTQLAYHLADYFDPDGYGDHFFVFNTKSTSVANDLLYRYDSLGHFQYIQNHKNALNPEQIEALFISYQALGAAIKSGQRAIVLIDEIDKAPRDFPNDILDVVEELAFEIPELGRVAMDKIKAQTANRPFVIFTSNSEKNLPDAFLRRCVYYHIPFPNNEHLLKILRQKISDFEPNQLDVAIAHFNKIREICNRKPPATAELLQWVSILERLQQSGRFAIDRLMLPADLSGVEKEELLGSYSLLIKDKDDLLKVKKRILMIE